MQRLRPATRRYAWGSATAIPEALGTVPDGGPVAEAWFGAHPKAPAEIETTAGWTSLVEQIARSPRTVLGDDVVARFGGELPYLLKIIAADRPLSLQVHPDLRRAEAGFRAEEERGVGRDAVERSYPDRNHKPELLYALTPFEALAGFRAPRKAAELLAGLASPLAMTLRERLRAQPDAAGIRGVFRYLLDEQTRPDADAVHAVVAACAARLVDFSPSPRADRTVVQLGEAYPGDPGAVTSLLLNPVSLQPGEALFVPTGAVHAYLSGVGIEIMASSDNVLRAGLTSKHVDIPGLLDTVDCVAAPPIRIAPEVFHGATRVYYAPVDDFELSVTTVADHDRHPLPGRGPRILVCLEGEITVHAGDGEEMGLVRGNSAFVPSSDGDLSVTGHGTLVQADVP